MALVITPKELERQATLAFVGKRFKVLLANDPGATLSSTSSTAAILALECSGHGYEAGTGTVASGAYVGGTARYELPDIAASFSAVGGSVTYTHLALLLGDDAGGGNVTYATYPHSILAFPAPVVLLAGESRGYAIKLIQDD